MDGGWPTGTHVAVRNGHVLSVGTLDDLKPWLDACPHAFIDDYNDKIIMPGFVEAHGHPLIGGLAMTRPLLTYHAMPNPYGADFPGVKTHDEAMSKIREYLANLEDAEETLLCWGYDVVGMGGEHLNKEVLDKLSANRALVIWDSSEHFAYANSAALKKYGITKADTKTIGIVAGPDGEPNGQFLGELAAQKLMTLVSRPLLTPQSALKFIKYLMDLSRKNGITTTSELGFGLIDANIEGELLNAFFNNPSNPVRLIVVSDAVSASEIHGDQAIAEVQRRTAQNSDKLMFHGVKFFADDAFLSLGMAIENPGYVDGRQGIYMTPPDEMTTRWLPWWQAGFHIHVHTNGNGGNTATVNALDGLMKAHPRADHRFTLEHYGISTPELARRISSLGGLVSTNPYYLYHRSELTAPYIGSDRAFTANRLRSLLDAGVIVSLHSDAPVGPPFPLEEVWIAVNRFGDSGNVRGAGERVSVAEALRMITIDAAYTLGVEDKVGSISPGKFADFVILEEDPYEVKPEAIRDIKVLGTVFGGAVYPASEIKP